MRCARWRDHEEQGQGDDDDSTQWVGLRVGAATLRRGAAETFGCLRRPVDDGVDVLGGAGPFDVRAQCQDRLGVDLRDPGLRHPDDLTDL